MSPPTKTMIQEGLSPLVNYIKDFDNTNVRKVEKKEPLDAVEHDYQEGSKVPVAKREICQKDGEICCEKQCDGHNDHLKDELELVCLHELHSTHIVIPTCLSSHGCGTDSASLGEVEPHSYPPLKRKNSYENTTSGKRTKLSIGHHGHCEAAGGGKKTNQKGTTGSGKSGTTTAVTKTCLAGGAVGNHGCQGGGGGDGGEDGDGQGNNEKRVHDCSFKSTSSKKKKRSRSDKNKMEEDGSSSHASPMDVDPRSSERQSRVGINSPGAAKAEEKPRANEKSQRPADQQATLNYFMEWHRRINHFIFCNKNCHRCRWVDEKILTFHVDEQKNGCTCQHCNMRSQILKFHQQKIKCTFRSCRVCETFVPPPDAQQHSPLQNVGQGFVQNVPPVLLNIPSVPSFGSRENEAVIYRDDSLHGLTHFREHIDFTFKKSRMVGKGGNGEVHDVELDVKFKNRYPCFANGEFVVKKVTIKEDDELKVFEFISTHPNFVETHLVANRVDGEFRQLILMKKCDYSLRDYIGTKKKSPNGQILNLYEAIHYWAQVVDAVAFLHNLPTPVVHKDIKSANVLVTKETNFVRAKLADYDAVKLLHNEYTQSGLTPKGTKYFVSPEVALRQAHGRPADIYSMGMFLLELLFGNLMKTPAVAIRKLYELDRDLAELIHRCILADPQQRPTAVQIQISEAVRKYSQINEPTCSVNKTKTTESCAE